MKKSKVTKMSFILLGAAILLTALIAFIALQPSEFKVTRSAAIAAPPPMVFEQVNDLHRWEAWSPWAKLDPNAKWTYEGPPAGVGAAFAWSGNKNIGEGRMTITDSRPNELVRFRLDFVKPFASTCSAEFTLQPEGERTAVTWSMEGKNNFVAKAMSLFVNCDKMVGEQFEKGLADIKSIAEKTAKGSPVLSREGH
jgi:hypothetical protein